LLRARERRISRTDAVPVIQQGTIVEQYPETTPYPKCLMMAVVKENRPMYVSLAYSTQDRHLYVITVHWLDPESGTTRGHASQRLRNLKGD
jgi:hypothetical protein